MAKAAGELHNAGMHHVSIGRINSSFAHRGAAADPETISDGTTLNAIHAAWADNLVQAQPTRKTATSEGGNQPGPSIFLGVSDNGEATITFALENETLSALLEGVTIDAATVSDWLMTGHNPRLDTFYNYITVVSSKVVGDGIAQHWMNKIYLNCEIAISEYPGASQADGLNNHMITITMKPDDSTRTPWGSLHSAGSNAFTDNKTPYMEIRADAPLSITTHVASSSDTTFVLGFRPLSTDVAAVSQIFAKDGVTTSPTSVVIATGVVTIPSASAQEEWIAFYETFYETI
ncbi:MAG TPA: hypothetical protein ENI05_12850 [Porticoccus sp.]|nr:hypothetical protein [Porticoccus sp.]